MRKYQEEFGKLWELNPIWNSLTPEQKSFIQDMLAQVDEGTDNFGNENETGNKLYQIVKQWAESRT